MVVHDMNFLKFSPGGVNALSGICSYQQRDKQNTAC